MDLEYYAFDWVGIFSFTDFGVVRTVPGTCPSVFHMSVYFSALHLCLFNCSLVSSTFKLVSLLTLYFRHLAFLFGWRQCCQDHCKARLSKELSLNQLTRINNNQLTVWGNKVWHFKQKPKLEKWISMCEIGGFASINLAWKVWKFSCIVFCMMFLCECVCVCVCVHAHP